MNESHMTFTDIVLGGGAIAMAAWALLFLLSILGITLSVISLIQAKRSDGRLIPLSTKLLAICALTTLTIGAFITVSGYMGMFSCLGVQSSDRAAIMKQHIEMANVSVFFALAAAALPAMAMAVSIHMVKAAARRTATGTTKGIPGSAYILAAVLVIAIAEATTALNSLSKILTFKPYAEPSTNAPLESLATNLSIGSFAGLAGIALTAFLVIASIFKSFKNRGKTDGLPENL